MTQHDTSPFDEQAALVELERLQAAIQAARRQRLQVHDQFDTFVRTMRQPQGSPPPSGLVRAGDRPWASDVARPSPPPLPSVTPLALTSSADRPDTIETIPAEQAGPPVRRSRLRHIAAAAAAIVLVVVIFLLYPTQPAEPPHTAQTPAGGANTAPTTPPEKPSPTSSTPAPVSAVQIELTTIRPAWMRVIVDDQRVVEREIPAGQRLRYSATREIRIRAGDAGAVLVRVGAAEPVPLGRNGFPATRIFR